MNKNRSNIWLFGITSFLNDFGSEAIKALLPLYIQSSTMLGAVGGLFDGLGELLKYIFALISEKFGKRKPFVVFGYALSAFSKLLIPLVNKTILPILIVFDRIGKASRDSSRDSMIADEKDMRKGYSIQRALDSLGALFGVLFAYSLLKILNFEIRKIMLIAALIGLLSVIPVLFAVEFDKIKKKERNELILNSSVLVLLASGLVFLTPLLFVRILSQKLKYDALIGYGLYAIFESISAYIMYKLAKKIGIRETLRLSFILAFFAMLLINQTKYVALFALALYGLGRGLFKAASVSYIAEKIGKNPATIGLFKSFYGLGIIVSSILFGYLMNIYGNNAILLFASLSFAFALLIH